MQDISQALSTNRRREGWGAG